MSLLSNNVTSSYHPATASFDGVLKTNSDNPKSNSSLPISFLIGSYLWLKHSSQNNKQQIWVTTMFGIPTLRSMVKALACGKFRLFIPPIQISAISPCTHACFHGLLISINYPCSPTSHSSSPSSPLQPHLLQSGRSDQEVWHEHLPSMLPSVC